MTARPAPIVRFTVVESTQTTAFDLAAEGAVDGTVVVADHQSAGRGRRGRAGGAAPGKGPPAPVLGRPRGAPPPPGAVFIADGGGGGAGRPPAGRRRGRGGWGPARRLA